MLTKPPVGTQINLSHPLSRGLVEWWMFNEGSGSRIRGIRQGLTGTLTNLDPPTAWRGSEYGGALLHEGGTDQIGVPNHRSISIGGPLSLSVTVTFTSADNDDTNVIIAKGFATPNYLMYFTADGNNTPVFFMTNVVPANLDGTTTLPSHQAHHLVGVFTGSSTRLYINGELDAEVSSTGTPLEGEDELAMGAASLGNLPFNGGYFDDVRIYNRVLTADEVYQIYTQPYASIVRRRA